MAGFAVMSLLAVAQIGSSTNKTLSIGIQEMQKANYFAFVMLLKMVSPDKIPRNVTFLMPNNRILANNAVIPENDVLDFLLMHSIPSSLRFDNLNHFPTGSIIPSSRADYALRISNNGRKSFYFNNVKLVSPDLCVSASSSVRCHGIDGVLVNGPLPDDGPPMTTAPPPTLPLPPPYDLAPAATLQPAGSVGPAPKTSSGSSYVGLKPCFILAFFWVLLPMLYY
ncbi:hypothetical protein RND81_05G046500 [Saponaria officinalis]|uniref:FAS1 domain-containing protein n=1 Tax=Saponaria officinalis TaxID=3572 RepID=A0AAW1KXH0_SAPOF